MKTFYKIILLVFFVNSISCLNKQKDCKCRILPESKIVGGEKAHHLGYPWMVSLSVRSDDTNNFLRRFINDETKLKYHSCGGIIINEYWILTAAHCIPYKNRPVYVGFGNDNDLVKIFDSGRIKSKRTIKMPKFKEDSVTGALYFDIGLIKLEKPIQFSENVKPACILKKSKKLYSGLLELAGWGSTEIIKKKIDSGVYSGLKTSRNLKEMFLVDKSDTHRICKNDDKIICAKGIKENESSCNGDSGGPVHYTENGKSYVVGLTSYSTDPKVEDGFYHFCVSNSVYSKVSNYIDWIKNYIDDDLCEF